MKLSERVNELYFKKYDDQMDGLTDAEEFELACINVAMDKLMTNNNDYTNKVDMTKL